MNPAWTRFLPQAIRGRLDGRQTLQGIISNTAWLVADKLLRMGVGLLVNVWLARYLGPTQYGTFNYALAFVALFSSLASLGLDGIVVRDIVREPSSRDETLGSAFVLKFVGGIATLLLTVASIALLRPADGLTLWLVGITAAGTVFQAFDTIDFWFQSQVRSKYVVYARNTAFLAVSLVKVVLILSRAPLIAFAWAGFSEIVLGAAGLVICYRVQGHYLKGWTASLTRARKLLSDSWPIVLGGLALYVHARIDQVMLGEMIGNYEVGQYSAAMRLIETFGFIPTVIVSSVAPEITRSKSAGEGVYHDKLLNMYRLMVILFLLTSLPIFLFADRFVLLFYGNEYKAAGVLFSLFAIRLFFTNLGSAKSLYIINENMFRYSLVAAVVGSITNVALNYALIPKYASIGAIWAMIISFFVSTFLIDVVFGEMRGNLRLMALAVATPWRLKVF
jgi:O-antigen/teichoic acid export membrane protein